jgi:SNF2 family DNA or RNA helicase
MGEAVGTTRITLSGTPVENKLADLHSQFEFILPGYLASSRAEFDRNFGKPLLAGVRGKQECEGQRELLQRIIQPFVLRRLKTDPNIAADLPEKVERVIECELADGQQALYKAVQEADLAGLDAEGNAPAAFARHGRVLAMIHALRAICNHPQNLKAARRPAVAEANGWLCPRLDVSGSGKCAALQELLLEILGAGEKVVIFCQYLDTITLLEEQITANFNSKVLHFVGAMDTAERERVVHTFQTDPGTSVLLLSLQAGGVGITLTAATHVIHFDRCYNPAKEAQATDRVHRIGQTKTVFVHRLVAKGTFEERLAEIMEEKQKLSAMAPMAGENWIADLNNAELRNLFSLRSDNTVPSPDPAPKRQRTARRQADL